MPLSEADKTNPAVRELQDAYTASLKESLGSQYYTISKYDDEDDPNDSPLYEFYKPEVESDPKETPLQEVDKIQHEAFDKYISARVCIPQGDNMSYGMVINRKRNLDGELVGHSSDDPFRDTSVYHVRFDSGEVEEYTANLIAESLYEQLDPEGNMQLELAEIVDHRTNDNAISADQGLAAQGSRQQLKRTTRGWFLCCQYKDGSTEWKRLVDMKGAYPLETAAYAHANQPMEEPAFAWWAPNVLLRQC
jgi:hypothetical protein